MKLKIWITGVCLLLTLAACTPPTTPAPGTTDGGTDTTGGEGGDTGGSEGGSGDFDLDPLAGLADRPYTATLTVSFDGTRDGAPHQWTDTMTQIVTLDPPARALTVTTDGAASESGAFAPWSAEIDGISYVMDAEGICSASVIPAEMADSEIPDLALLLPAVTGASEAGSETVNGVETTAYTLDAPTIGTPEGTTASGTAWVAADGTLMRYTVTIEGDAAYFGEGREGTITYDYQLSDATEIAIPAECPAGLIDVAHLPDAADLVEEPGATSYTTASDIAAVVAHYQEQLSGSGWEPQGEPLIGETTALLDFVQGDQQLSILITVADGVTHVQLLIIPALEDAPPAGTGEPPTATTEP
jgi:hypothetical protein